MVHPSAARRSAVGETKTSLRGRVCAEQCTTGARGVNPPRGANDAPLDAAAERR
jgi:hypothetical protein